MAALVAADISRSARRQALRGSARWYTHQLPVAAGYSERSRAGENPVRSHSMTQTSNPSTSSEKVAFYFDPT